MSVRPHKNKKGEPVPHAWQIDRYPQGRKGKKVLKVVLNCTEAQAKQIELALIRQHVHQVMPHDPLVRDVVAEWLKTYRLDHSEGTLKDIGWALLKLLPHFGGWHMSRLTLPLFEQYMLKRSTETWRPPIKNPDPEKKYAPAKPDGKRRINTELKYMALIVKYAVDKRYILRPPFEVPKFKNITKKVKILPGGDEIDRLLLQCHPDARLAVLLFNDAGLRRNEALQLQAENVLLEDEILHVLGKGNKERFVPISTDRLCAALTERLAEVPAGYLLKNPRTGQPYKDLRKAIEAAADRAGVTKGIYNHLFRNVYTTTALEAGVDLDTIRQNLGHADLKTTQVYLHSRLKHRISESRKVQEYQQSERALSAASRQKKAKKIVK